ncbi:MAG: hypothetical protein WCE64_05395 [Bacteroidales bacterium]
MDLNSTIDIIIKDLNEAREIIDDLKKYPGVPALQVELAKSKCKSASEVIALFKDLPPKAADTKESALPESKAEIQKPEVKVEPSHTREPEEKKKELIQPVVQEHVPETPEIPVKEPKKYHESAILADQFSNRPASFNEELESMKHGDDISEILKTQPIASLSDAIGINDKFLFMREIFNGDIELYNRTIAELDSVVTLHDATHILSGHIGDKGENDAARQLQFLLKRKFTSNE